MSEVEKTEEQIARDKANVEKMRGAASAMTAALSRIDVLERALRSASSSISYFKGFVGSSAYVSSSTQNNPITCHSRMDAAMADITKALG